MYEIFLCVNVPYTVQAWPATGYCFNKIFSRALKIALEIYIFFPCRLVELYSAVCHKERRGRHRSQNEKKRNERNICCIRFLKSKSIFEVTSLKIWYSFFSFNLYAKKMLLCKCIKKIDIMFTYLVKSTYLELELYTVLGLGLDLLAASSACPQSSVTYTRSYILEFL